MINDHDHHGHAGTAAHFFRRREEEGRKERKKVVPAGKNAFVGGLWKVNHPLIEWLARMAQ